MRISDWSSACALPILTVGRAWTGISALMIVAYVFLLYRLITFIRTPYANFLIVGMIIFMAAAVTFMVLVNFVSLRMVISSYNIHEMRSEERHVGKEGDR